MRRVLIFVLLAAVLLVAGFLLLGRPSSKPAPVNTANAPAAAPPPSEPPPAIPPEAKAPVETPRPAPRPRTAAPGRPVAPEPAPAASADAATLQIDVDVPDAQVFVDRVFVGKAPLTTSDVKPGSHRLNVSATGYEGVAQSIEVKPGTQQVTVKLREVRLDAGLDVVHKHRVGSCKGRLVATPQGMRYETSDKDDAFRSGLLDPGHVRGGLPEEEPAHQAEEREVVRLHGPGRQCRPPVRVPSRRGQGPGAPQERRPSRAAVAGILVESLFRSCISAVSAIESADCSPGVHVSRLPRSFGTLVRLVYLR